MGRDYTRLADAIKREYAARGWTQKDLADRARISPSALTDLLRGKHHNRVPNSVAKIEAAFEWPIGTARRILEGQDHAGGTSSHVDEAKRIAADMSLDDQIELIAFLAAQVASRRQNPG